MPVRDKAVDKALRTILGKSHTMSFNNAQMTAKVNGEEMTRDEFNERFWDPIDRTYERVVDSIDWNRVLLEATSRHIVLEHPDGDYGDICPECVNEALLAGDTWQDWERNPNVERLP